MLQPKNDATASILKIIWLGLTVSTLLYGFMLHFTEKVSHLALPQGDLSELESAALLMNLVVVFTLGLYAKKIKPEKDIAKRFPVYIICWALNESAVLLAFAAVFTSESGNAFIFATNFTIGLIANIMTFPKAA